MIENLMYVSSGLIIVAFVGYLLLTFIIGRKRITDSDGFNITKDILDEYNSINIIENKSILTVYNVKRRVIKIASNNYYGNSLSNIGISLMEAGISAIDNEKNKSINLFRYIFSNLKWLYIFSIMAIGINSITYNVSDARVSIVFLILFSIISYMFINIKSEAILWTSDKIKKVNDINKVNKEKLVSFLNKILLLDKLLFIGELIMIIRFVMILLEM